MAKKNTSISVQKKRSRPVQNSRQKGSKKKPAGGTSWPGFRQVLHRPDRMKYVRKVDPPSGCVFCEAHLAPPQLENLCLFHTPYSMVILNKYPYNSGHMMVIPKRHCGDLLSLSQEEWRDLSDLLRQAQEVLTKVYQPTGLNIGLNHGASAGAGIPEHLHFHIVPRWAGDLNFFPLIAETKVVIETLEQSYGRLRLAFQKLEKAK